MGRRDFFRENKIKKIVTTSAITGIAVIIACVTIFVMYSKSMDEKAKSDLLALTDEKDEIVENEKIQLTSTSKDKTVTNSLKSLQTNSVEIKKAEKPSKDVVSPIVEKEEVSENSVNIEIKEVELKFIAPVSGEIIKNFANDTLVYSDTLQEWCTHNGIDIKADKATVVVASENGIVESIKNDPRYGLTVIIKHENGFKTVYSNLLTAEFVSENETVEKGQTIATVGNSASFEILDESHLHFEMYKDGEAVNPTIYF